MSLRWMTVGLMLTIAPLATLPAQAQAPSSCTPLLVVDGQGTSVSKGVSPPSTGVTRDNWNTDFVVPSNETFARYVATIVPKNGGNYDLKMSLKYNNDTSDEVYSRGAYTLLENRPFSFSGTPRTNSTPYQVNVSVGGLSVLGNSYTLSVQGCR